MSAYQEAEPAVASIPSRDLAPVRGTDALSTPAVGSAANDLVTPCERPGPRHKPPPAADGVTVAVALSGGGFRATLSGLGVLQLLADSGLLGNVRYSSSVSGGSVANGIFAHHYDELAAESFSGEAFHRIVVAPCIERISGSSLTWKLVGNVWRIVGPKTRVNLLADSFAEWFFGQQQLAATPAGCRFVFNAANLTTGVRFALEREIVGDYVSGYVRTDTTGLRLADAVAASAAFPIGFNPMHLRGLELPCGNGRPVKLQDGGVYDNMGLDALDHLCHDELIVAINAGGLFYVRRGYGWIPVIRDFLRINSILYRQSTALRRREMVERFKAWETARGEGAPAPPWARRGVLFGLTTSFDDGHPVAAEWMDGRPERAELTQSLARVKTSFAGFDRETCEQLVYRGWWLTGATLATYHREVLPAVLPSWRG
jgi:NTE family protein